jgi:hypothetical protein
LGLYLAILPLELDLILLPGPGIAELVGEGVGGTPEDEGSAAGPRVDHDACLGAVRDAVVPKVEEMEIEAPLVLLVEAFDDLERECSALARVLG